MLNFDTESMNLSRIREASSTKRAEKPGQEETTHCDISANAVCAITNIAVGLTTRKGCYMRAPSGAVAGLCSASATMFSVGMAFLGYWGLYEPGGWRSADLVIVILALVGFAALGSVPWIVTTPVADDGEEKVVAARRALALGVVLIWLSVFVSVFT